jgi:hypothetical protein
MPWPGLCRTKRPVSFKISIRHGGDNSTASIHPIPKLRAMAFAVYSGSAISEGENLPPSSRSVAEPKPALEMAIALRALQPESIRPRIAAIVFDVSGPSALASTASRAKKAKPRTCVGKTPAGKKERSHARWPRGAAARL